MVARQKWRVSTCLRGPADFEAIRGPCRKARVVRTLPRRSLLHVGFIYNRWRRGVEMSVTAARNEDKTGAWARKLSEAWLLHISAQEARSPHSRDAADHVLCLVGRWGVRNRRLRWDVVDRVGRHRAQNTSARLGVQVAFAAAARSAPTRGTRSTACGLGIAACGTRPLLRSVFALRTRLDSGARCCHA